MEDADELKAPLDEHGLARSTAQEFASGADLAVETVQALAGPGGEVEVEASGYSEKQVEDLLKNAAKAYFDDKP